MQLYEKYRPKNWGEVVGQDAAVAKLLAIKERSGFGAQAFWLAGGSGTGKTTIARLIAGEVADGFATIECDAASVTADVRDHIERATKGRPIGGRGWAFVVNEAHGLTASQVRPLLVMLEAIPEFAVWVFTTTRAGQDKLFEDLDDAGPLLSRCVEVKLSSRDLCKAFAVRCKEIAMAEGLDGKPVEAYERVLKDKRNNFRGALQAIQAGEMLAKVGGE